MDKQLIHPVGFQPTKVFQEIWRFHACGPHHQLRFDLATIGQADARWHDLHDFGAGEHLNAQARKKLLSGLGHAWHQSRQNAVCRLNQADFDIFIHINAVQAKSHHLAGGSVQLCSQLHTRCARADDGHMQLSFVDKPGLVVRADTGIDHPGMKGLGVMLRFQLQRVLFDPLGAEVIA